MYSTELFTLFSKALGWTLLHSLWQGLLIFLLLWAALGYYKKKSPQLRYLFSCMAMCCLIGGIGFTFSYYFSFPAPSSVSLALSQESGTAATLLSDHTPVTTSLVWWDHWQDQASQFIHLYARYLVSFWLVGVLLFGFRWIGGLYFTYRLRSEGAIAIPRPWQAKVQALANKLGIHRSVQLLESSKVEVPLTIGHLKPIILLPVGMLAGLTPQQVESILIHELAHIRRHDFVVNLLLSALEILLFYHPVFWWISSKIQEERELCCDDIAVATCGNPRLYARTLLLMEEKRQQMTLAMAYQGKKQHLKYRIKRICLSTPSVYHQTISRTSLALLFLLGVGVMAWAKLPATLPLALEETLAMEELAMDVTSMPELPLPQVANQETSTTHTVTETESTTITVASSKVKKDTIPPVIPSMRKMPELPTPPNFSSTAADLKKELKKSEGDSKVLRASIDNYRAQVEDWKSKVQEEYLSAWDNRRQEIQSAYKAWQDRLAAAYRSDDLRHAIAFKKGSEAFEESLNETEEAINESEDVIDDGIESYLEDVEVVIEEKENQIAEHRERMDVHHDRMSVHRLRMSIHGTRMDVHRERMNLHRDRMAIHRDRMAAHTKIMKAFKAEFFVALKKDGFVKSEDDDIDFRMKGETITINGTKLSAAQAQKYLKLVRKYDFQVQGDQEWHYRKNSNSSTMGTYFKSREE